MTAALDLKGQATAQVISDNMLNLTKETVDDSTSVRIVTFVTLIYLPASFVAVSTGIMYLNTKLTCTMQSLFGMNFFTFETAQESGFQVSAQFWIFLILSLPLTLLTVGAWFIIMRKKNKKRALSKRLVVQDSGEP